MPKDIKKLIGARIKELRKKRGLSQEKAAASADITSKHLSSIELGKENPTLDTFLKLAAAFEVDLWELLNYGHEISGKELRARITVKLRNSDEEDLRLVLRFLNTLKD